MNNQIVHKNKQTVVTGNASATIALAEGTLEAIIISNDQDTSNVAKSVSIVADVADGLTVTFGPLVIGNGKNIYHPRKQAVAADLSTAVAGIYEPYYISGKVAVTVTAGDANDVTRVQLVLVP